MNSYLDRLTLHMAIASYMGDKPLFRVWNIARKAKRATKDKNIRKFMNMVLHDHNAVLLVREMAHASFNKS